MDCGEEDIRVLEFDHVEDKIADVCHLVLDGASPEVIEMEIELCDVVCANCHRRRTLARKREARHPDYDLKMKLNGVGRNLAHVRERLAESGCVDCGEDDAEVLEFDHVEEKLASVSSLAWAGSGIDRINEEIERCEVRCVNCHRIRTAQQLRYARHHWVPGEAA